MKIRPVILCGGAGTRLWPNSKKNQAKQFIDFGGWTLLGKTLERITGPLYDAPIISTNLKYYNEIIKLLRKYRVKNFKILLEPAKRNTGPAILSSALIKDIPSNQPLLFLSADHLIENSKKFNKEIKKNKKNLTNNNIFIFGIKPTSPSDQFGYFISKKSKKSLNQVSKFLEKPNKQKAKKIISKGGYWNSGMFLIKKESVLNNFKKYQINIYNNSLKAIQKSKYKNNTYYLNKSAFAKNISISFDCAILERTDDIFAVKLDMFWSDLGSWKEILLMYSKNKKKYLKKKNIFQRPWGRYTNLFSGKKFLIKELYVKPKGILSLQKHYHRSEHWVVIQGTPKITLNKKFFKIKPYETIFIPQGAIHRIQNNNEQPVKIMEVQIGSILRESDIVRYEDIYGRVN